MTADIALRFKLNPNSNMVTLNSRSERKWGEEGQVKNSAFQKKKLFEMTIFTEKDKYKVSVKDQETGASQEFSLPQNIPFKRVTHLAIRGGVEIKSIRYG
ncbi:LGALS7 [Branchiostoma lanceolatum]|uniref:Galectin n=1 Tax=Branchiostoma lanceolatum TaxID=7740 RepID=A0A8J9W522_BRALA|nr:LGALS7 [Branchiostoma lanceolatum]